MKKFIIESKSEYSYILRKVSKDGTITDSIGYDTMADLANAKRSSVSVDFIGVEIDVDEINDFPISTNNPYWLESKPLLIKRAAEIDNRENKDIYIVKLCKKNKEN